MAENYIDKIEVDGVERPIRDTSGSVRYDAAQTLSDEQKAKARGNIDAAPGGFGWGDSFRELLASDTDDTYETYCGKIDALLADMPDGTSQLIYARGPSLTGQYYGAGNIVAALSKILGTSASLVGISPDPRGTTNGLWRMLKNNGKWQPVEWINPPMELGTEYRTTERYLGKPVYTKVVACSFSGAGTTSIGHGIANIDKCVAVTGIALQKDSSYSFSFPYWFTNGSTLTQGVSVSINTFSIALNSVTDYSATFSAQVTINYTKTTD